MQRAIFARSPKYDIKRTATGKIVASDSYVIGVPTGSVSWGSPAPMVRWPQIIANLSGSSDVGTEGTTFTVTVSFGATLFNGTLTWKTITSTSSTTFGTGTLSLSASVTLEAFGWWENQNSFPSLFPTKLSWGGNGTSFLISTNSIKSGAVQSKLEIASITRRRRILFPGV